MHYINKPLENGVILRRRVNPNTLMVEVSTNVPWNIKYHSPSGFEWGYGGSGPADLALNLAEQVTQKAELETNSDPLGSSLAWNAKQTVKELVVMPLPEAGGVIPWKMVCYAVMDACTERNRTRLQKYIDKLSLEI